MKWQFVMKCNTLGHVMKSYVLAAYLTSDWQLVVLMHTRVSTIQQ